MWWKVVKNKEGRAEMQIESSSPKNQPLHHYALFQTLKITHFNESSSTFYLVIGNLVLSYIRTDFRSFLSTVIFHKIKI